MTVHPAVRGTWTFVFAVLLCGGTISAQGPEELPPEIDSEGVQTLTRGPVHEAFASPAAADPAPGMIIPKAPPEDIKETPPEYQPEGDNVQWFPGYWAWDEDRDDFIWISGIWRDPPPGRRWVPGYWAEVSGGFQWVAGFWIPEQVEEMEYLKPPPASLEQGPSVASPGDDYFYIPGSWAYVNDDYRWSAGYWAPYREEWVYVQPQWVWTPRGCIYNPGYYDWRAPRRGQIFAPVYINPVVYGRPAYVYTPRCVINTSNLFVHLWVRDSYCHYYFGNYYGPTYVNRHFTPWCNYNSRPRCYDPLLNYCNVHYRRQGIDYVNRVQGWHKHYDKHEHERPAMTYREQVARLKTAPNAQNRPIFLASDLKDVVRGPDKHWKKQDLAQRDHNKSSIEQIRDLHKLRFDQEKVSLAGGPGRDLPGRGPGRDRPSRDSDGDGPKGENPKGTGDKPDVKLPGRGPGIGNLTEDLKPGDKPGVGRPGLDKVAMPGKVKLPKPTVAVNKPAIKVPELPEKAVISRPGVNRPGIDRPGIDRTGSDKPGLDKPAVDKIGGERGPRPGTRPGIGGKPAINPPDNAVGKVPEIKPSDKKTEEPKAGDGLPSRLKPSDLTRPGRDLSKPKTPSIEAGNAGAVEAAQDRLKAIRQQQQDALDKVRKQAGGQNPGSGSSPKIEIPKREASPVTRPPLSSDRPAVTPRATGGGTNPAVENRIKDLQNRLNQSRGNSAPRVETAPRSISPSVEPRTLKPTVEPRTTRPNVERPQVQLQPRNSGVPRSSPNPNGANGGGGGNSGEKGERKRGR